MGKLVALLLTDYLASPQVIALINYIILAGDTADAEAFIRELALRIPQHEDELMTIAQQLEQKGVEKGVQQGIRTVAEMMLKQGIAHDVVMKVTGLSGEELARLGR